MDFFWETSWLMGPLGVPINSTNSSNIDGMSYSQRYGCVGKWGFKHRQNGILLDLIDM